MENTTELWRQLSLLIHFREWALSSLRCSLISSSIIYGSYYKSINHFLVVVIDTSLIFVVLLCSRHRIVLTLGRICIAILVSKVWLEGPCVFSEPACFTGGMTLCISFSWYTGMNHILDNGRSIRLGSYTCTINRSPTWPPNNSEYTALNAKYNFAVYIWDLCFAPNWSMNYPSPSDSPLFTFSLTQKLETII